MKRKSVIYFGITFVLFIAGCSGVKGLFSKGQDELKLANQAWEKGEQLQSLVHATQSVIIDPEFFQGKTFLNERFNPTIEKTQQRLKEVENPSNSQLAEEQYAILTKLVLIYTNLKEIKLPINHPKGKWSWTTEIIDYTSKREQARLQAFNLLMKEGRDFVSRNRVKEAEAALMNAVLNYSIDENEKNSYKRVVAGELCSRANTVLRTQVIEEAIIAHEFFKSARKFISDYAEAKEGEAKSATHVSELYVQQGKQIENSKEIEIVITAVDSYKNAIKWDGKNQNAKDALKAVTERIAEYYYQEGTKAEKAKDYTNAIAQFENVRKWIPDYKDAMSRIYNMRIGGKIEEFAKNVGANRGEFNKLQTRTTSVSTVVDKSAEVMDKVTYISDKSRSLNDMMKKTSSTLKLFSIIPVVGSTTNILAKTVDIAQDPIGVVATKFDKLEAPVVTPTKNVVTGTKSIVDNVKGKMGTTDNILKVTEDYSLRLKSCISKITEETKFKEAELALDEINKGLVNSNKAMVSINGSFTKVENEGKKISQMVSNVSKVTSGFESVTKAVSKIEPVVDELNKVLDKKISVAGYGFSIKQVLNGVSGPVKWVMDQLSDLAMSALKPVLKKFDISIPSVPGLSEFSKQIDSLKENYDLLNAELTGLKSSVTEFTNSQNIIQTNLTKLEKSVGCEIAPSNKQ